MFNKFHCTSKKLHKEMISEPLASNNSNITPPSSSCSSTYSSSEKMYLSSGSDLSNGSFLTLNDNEEKYKEIKGFEKLNSFSIEKSISKLVLDNGEQETTNETIISVAQTLNQERAKIETRYYIFDRVVFEKSMIKQKKFNIFGKRENGIGFKSCKYVLHELIKRLKREIINNDSSLAIESANDIFSPNLSQTEVKKLYKAKEFIQSLFPHDGCSLKGEKLQKIVNFMELDYIIISIRVIISLLPNGGLINEEFYHEFSRFEFKNNFNKNSFYKVIPLISENECQAILLQEFLELVILSCWLKLKKAGNDSIEKQKDLVMDLVNTAAAVSLPINENSKIFNLIVYKKICISRNFKFQRIFLSYLRNLKYLDTLKDGSKKVRECDYYHNINDTVSSVMNEDLINYPPLEYQTNFIEYGLVISIDKRQMFNNDERGRRRKRGDIDQGTSNSKNFYNFLENVESCKKIWYSNQDFFYFDEQVFIKNFLNDTCESLSQQSSDLSLEYLCKFDFDKQLYKELEARREPNRHKSTTISESKNSRNKKCANFEDSEDANSKVVKVSKMVMTNWFYNNWKLDTSMGNLKSTFIFELKHKIGQIQWLVLTVEDFESLNLKNCIDPELLAIDDFLANKGIFRSKDVNDLDFSSQLSMLFSERGEPAEALAESTGSFTLVDNNPGMMFTISEAEENNMNTSNNMKNIGDKQNFTYQYCSSMNSSRNSTHYQTAASVFEKENYQILSCSSFGEDSYIRNSLNHDSNNMTKKIKRKHSERESYQSIEWNRRAGPMVDKMNEKFYKEENDANEFNEPLNCNDCEGVNWRKKQEEDLINTENQKEYAKFFLNKRENIKQFTGKSMMKLSPGYASLRDCLYVEV